MTLSETCNACSLTADCEFHDPVTYWQTAALFPEECARYTCPNQGVKAAYRALLRAEATETLESILLANGMHTDAVRFGSGDKPTDQHEPARCVNSDGIVFSRDTQTGEFKKTGRVLRRIRK